MTNKSLSEQICEVCGIKPEIIQDYELNYIEVYPDFENNNNNFVKLLELPIDYDDIDGNVATTIFSITLYCFKFSCKTKVEFLKQLLDCLKDSKAPYLIKQIKQAIRQADWEV